MKMLVIGIGNEMRADDGAGIYAVRKIREKHLPDVKAMEHSGEGTSLIELWKHQDQVIVIDAASSGSQPGTIHRYEAHRKSLPANLFRFSTHTLGLAEAIELSRVLRELPASLIVYGIEANTFDTGSALSPEVHSAIDIVLNEIISEKETNRTRTR
jgi:hydrogenase maturation protease